MRQRHRLSFGQEQLWFISQLSPAETAYNTTTVIRLRGGLNVDALRGALTAVIAHNDILRATFGAVDGVPFQTTAPTGAVDLVVHDLPGASDAAIDVAVARVATSVFDLEHGPLYRFALLRLAPDDHLFIRTIHHILIDGWSMGVIDQQLGTAYRDLLHGRAPELAPTTGYLDFVRHQREVLDEMALGELLAAYERRLVGLPVLDLPTDRSRPPVRSPRGGGVTLWLDGGLTSQLRELARRLGIPLFAPLLTGAQIVLCRYTGQVDLPLGLSMYGRDHPEWESIVGLFVNMVVLRGDLAGDPVLADVVERSAESLFDAYEYASVPFEKLVERLQPVREPNRNPLFQVAVQLIHDDNAGLALTLPGLRAEPLHGTVSGSRFDLTLGFIESLDKLRIEIEYSVDLFDRWRVEAMARHIERVLVELVRDPGQRLSAVALVGGEERDRVLAFGRGEPSTRTPLPVHAVFAKIAAQQPELLAATCRGIELTYGELDRRADLLARYLRSLGIRQEQIVAIALDRDLDFLVAALGVLKAGTAYTILDPGQPANRLEYILTDTAASVVLTRAALVGAVPPVSGCRVVCLDADREAIESMPADRPLAEWATRDSLVYALYTSGSTGRPKGVLLEHRALMSFAESYRRDFDLGPGERMLQLRPLTFDMSHGEIVAALTSGAALVLVPEEVATSPDRLAALIVSERVTYVGLPTALLALVEAGPYPSVRSVMNGGETIPGELVNKWNLPGRRFVNAYGPTEAAVVCTAYECEHRTWHSPPPIGAPYLDRQLFVVDRWENLVPIGVVGELLVGGAEGLARGYLNQPELTGDRFVPDPVLPGGRVYRTGDLVRWNPQGQLEFLGRRDTQVKLHGHRVELGEIEATLATHPGVAMAAVTVRADEIGDPRLCGYVVTAGERPPTVTELRDHARAYLPAYMVPVAWRILDEFPLNPSRKIDRAALPAPDETAGNASYVAPRTLIETVLADMFAALLDGGLVGVDDSFFDLGGNSLQAMRLVAKLHTELAVDLGVAEIFLAPTPRQLAAVLRDEHGLDDEVPGQDGQDF